jgi:hypothetical protein
MSKIRLKFGKPLIYKIEEVATRKSDASDTTTIKHSFKLLTYLDMVKATLERRKNFQIGRIRTLDASDVMNSLRTVNWRTYRNLTSVCAIEKVEMHHVNAGKVTGFTQVMKQLNRKQIPLCKKHHTEVEKGLYDGIRVTELIDIDRFLA